MGKKRAHAGGGWQQLPTEVMVLMFDLLGESRLAAAQVCKRWRNVAADQSFVIEADGERMTLTEAVAEAKPGYTVRVTAPFCQETIFIDKPLRIEGRVSAPGCADGCATVFQLRPPVVLAQARVLFVNMIFSTAASRSDVSIVCYGPECSSLSFQHCKFTGQTGLVLPISKQRTTRLVLHDCLITGMKNGLAGVLASTGQLEMRNCTIESNSIGLEVGEAAAADIRGCKIAFNSAAVHLDGAILMSGCCIWGNGRIGCKATENRMLEAMTRSQREAAQAVGQPPVAMTPAGGALLGARTPAPAAGSGAGPSNVQRHVGAVSGAAADAHAAMAASAVGTALGHALAFLAQEDLAPPQGAAPHMAMGSPRRAPQSSAMWRSVSPAVSLWQAQVAASSAAAASAVAANAAAGANAARSGAVITPAAPAPAPPPAAAAARWGRAGSRRAAGGSQLAVAASAAELMPPPPARAAAGARMARHAPFSEALKGAASLGLAFFQVHDTLVVPPEQGYKSAAEKANRKKVRKLAEQVYGEPEAAWLDWEIIAQSDLDTTDDEDDADVDSEGMDDAISDSDLDDPFDEDDNSDDDVSSSEDPFDNSDDDQSDGDDSSDEDDDDDDGGDAPAGYGAPAGYPVMEHLMQAGAASTSEDLSSSEDDDSDDSDIDGSSDEGAGAPAPYGLYGNGYALAAAYAAAVHAGPESSTSGEDSSSDDSSNSSGSSSSSSGDDSSSRDDDSSSSDDDGDGDAARGVAGVGPRRIFGSDSSSSTSSDSDSDSNDSEEED